MKPQANPRPLVLFGLETRYAFEVLELLQSAGLGVVGCVASDHDNEIAGDFPNFMPKTALEGRALSFAVACLTPGRRKLRVEEAMALGQVMIAPAYHRTAVVSPSAVLGSGALVGANSVIGANVTAGLQLSVNRAASVGHDCQFGDYCTVGPSATLCGGCVLDDGVFLGAGALICPKVHIGRNAVIGAGAVVTQDVKEGTVSVGNPARVIQSGVAGYRGIGV